MRTAALLAAVLPLVPLAAQEPLEVLRKTAAAYRDASGWRMEGVDRLEQTVRGATRTTERRFQAYSLRAAGMRVEFADGGIRLTDGRYEWNYNQPTKRYTKKAAPWDTRGVRVFNQFFFNYATIADAVKRADFLAPPGREAVVEVTYAFPGNVEETRTYAIDMARFVVRREISYPAPIVEPPVAGPVKLVRTVTFAKVELNAAPDRSLFTPPEDEARSGLAPDFTLDDLAGRSVALHDLRGRPVLLYFWASWCATCGEEMPRIEKLAREGGGPVVLGINDEDPAIASEYLRAKGRTLRSLVDRWDEVRGRYTVEAVPAVVLIAADGRIMPGGASALLAAQRPPALGSVEETGEACPAGPVASTTCRRLQVSVSGMKTIEAQIRVTEPARDAAARGTVVLGSGGGGNSFYGASPNGQSLVTQLAAMGFRVVDRAWTGGWTTHEGGLRKESCRYATLLTWVHDHLHRGGKFVATGNSGGSAEIGYALTTWGRGNILDLAIPTSGPPIARLDYACVREPSPEWAALCASLVPKDAIECEGEVKCILGTANDVCKQFSPSPTAEELRTDSVVHKDAVLDYPKTLVHFLFGARDCGEPVPAGLSYAAKITSRKIVEFVPRTPHAIASTPEGVAALVKAIDTGAR